MFEVVVIGGGPVGIFCAFELGVFGFKKICVVETSDKLGGQCIHMYPEKNIYDVAGLPVIKGEKLVENLVEQMNHFKPNVQLNTKIVKIIKTKNGFNLVTSDDRIIETYKIIFSYGKGLIKPRKPKISGFEEVEAAGVVRYSMNNLAAFEGKDILVAGGGDSALDWCFNLRGIAKNISLVHRSSLRAMKSSQELLLKMIDAGECNLMMPAEFENIEQNGKKWVATIKKEDQFHRLEFDYFMPSYGVEVEENLNLSFINDLNIHEFESDNEDFAHKDGVYFIKSSKWLTVGFAKALEVARRASIDFYGDRHIPHSSDNPHFGAK